MDGEQNRLDKDTRKAHEFFSNRHRCFNTGVKAFNKHYASSKTLGDKINENIR
jgi:hypothetical protein